jgi:chemotaxis protein methyltransferase CheR
METPPRPVRPLVAPLFSPVPDLDVVAYDRLASDVRSLLGIDLSQYKPAQVWRRVNGFAVARGLAGPDALVAKARGDSLLKQAFLDMLTINVSEFFRNPEAWAMLAEKFLKPLLRDQLSVRIWSAGCSLGYEPFTLAMLCREIAPAAPVRILATDLDDTILTRAKKATYTEQLMAGVSDARRSRFFRRVDDKAPTQSGAPTPSGTSSPLAAPSAMWEVKPELQALVTFKRHDLLKDPYEKPFDLICCRNVVIYFTEPAKADLYRRFSAALRPGGLLFLGATESIPNTRAVDLEPAGLTFYKRPM